jgi:hypothetical protein
MIEQSLYLLQTIAEYLATFVFIINCILMNPRIDKQLTSIVLTLTKVPRADNLPPEAHSFCGNDDCSKTKGSSFLLSEQLK